MGGIGGYVGFYCQCYCLKSGDGYGSEVENPVKRFYDVGEVMNYEHIENEWPLFYLYMIVDGMFEDDQEQVRFLTAQILFKLV